MSSDAIIRYEENNYENLLEKFIKQPEIVDLWQAFVWEEYENDMPEPDIDDRIKEDVFPPDETGRRKY